MPAIPARTVPAWAEVALPPPLTEPVAAPNAELAPDPGDAGPVDGGRADEQPADVPAVEGESAASPVEATPGPASRTGVRLGFADGSLLTLDESDPRSIAFRAAAEHLTASDEDASSNA